MKQRFGFGGLICLLMCQVLFACHPVPGPDKTFTGAVLGAGWGAGAGAVIGNQSGNVGPGTAIGAGFGAVSGLVTGIGLDITEGTELEHQRQLDALKVQVAANHRSLMNMQDVLDDRDRRLPVTAGNEQIFFDDGRASLRSGSAARLQRMGRRIKANPFLGHIELHGHSDDTGDADTNERLSEARARTVAMYLSAQGLSLDQMRVIAHGARRPLATNETESGRALNRRVEIVLVK